MTSSNFKNYIKKDKKDYDKKEELNIEIKEPEKVVEQSIEIKKEPIKMEQVKVTKKETKFVKKSEEKKIIQKPKIDKVGIVNANLLNVRTGPGFSFKNYSACPTIARGRKVEIIEEVISKDNSKWYKIKIKNPDIEQQVFVNADYIKI